MVEAVSNPESLRMRRARIAGAWYVVAVILGVFDLIILPARFIGTGDAAATAHAILAQRELFQALPVLDMACGTVWLLVVLALYRLLRDVDEWQGRLMLILGAYLQVPFYFFNAVNYAGALVSLTHPALIAAFSEMQRYAIALLFMRLHHYEFMASYVFAGLWLFPFGILVYKSRFLPRILGAWLVLEGFGWPALAAAGFAAPQYVDLISTISAPLNFAEVAIALWLVLFGARTTFLRSRAPSKE
jgi:uncharacterized protein DUF4386